MKRPELLSPAGTLNNMRYAFAYGADAVYAGQPRYSLRVRNNDFDLENLGVGIAEARTQGKKFYVASNIIAHNSKIKTYLKDMEPVVALKPDALIMADPGLMMMIRETWPEMPIHLSVQANATSYAAVKFWQSVGVERVILSRELSLDEIAEIRQQCPDMELEVFVHGALCIAYSGRCLLSGYFNHRDPNQGTCTNACRWDYSLKSAQESESGDIAPILAQPLVSAMAQERHEASEQVYLIEEGKRPGELMPVMEDEHGTYILNSKDLRALQHIQRLTEIGVDSLKIEGRTKSHYYVARTAQVYRQAIDDAVAGRPLDPGLMVDLDGLASRGYTDGFFNRHAAAEQQNYIQGSSISQTQQFVGEVVLDSSSDGMALIEVKNRFSVGDKLVLLTPGGRSVFTLDAMWNDKGQPVAVAPGSGHRVRLRLPNSPCEKGLITRLF